MRALAIAATGMAAQQTNVEVIANNLANINTTGFKRGKAEFSDLLYEAQRAVGVSSRGNDSTIPEGAQLGLGVKTVAIRNLQTQGSINQTGNTFDLALQGSGWFQVSSSGGETLYTRAGAFNTNGAGQLVTLDGNLISPAIVIPPNTTGITVSQSGIISGTVAGASTSTQFGQLTIAKFANDAGLEHLGGNLFRESAASGGPVVGVPADPGYATINQGYLEASNVDPVKEITDLISAQRAYEMNSKVIQAADQMSDTLSKGIR